MKNLFLFIAVLFLGLNVLAQTQFSSSYLSVPRTTRVLLLEKSNTSLIEIPYFSNEKETRIFFWTNVTYLTLRSEEKESLFQNFFVEQMEVQYCYADHTLVDPKMPKDSLIRTMFLIHYTSFKKDMSVMEDIVCYMGNNFHTKNTPFNGTYIKNHGYIDPASVTNHAMVTKKVKDIFSKLYDDRGCFPPKNKEEERNEENFRRVEKFLLSLR